MTVMGDADLHYFAEGTHRRAYGFLGAHSADHGVHFAVWAPNACRVSVIGDFNEWNEDADELQPVESTGIFAGFADAARVGNRYKYLIVSRSGMRRLKA